jgi:type VI protein secretion system component VasF
MSSSNPCPISAEPPRSRRHLPHWGWFLLATVVLVVGFIGLSVWLPYHRQQQVVQMIEGWGGNASATMQYFNGLS